MDWPVASGTAEIGLATPTGLAGRYAQALYAHADEARALDQVVEQMDALGRLIDASRELRALVASPLLDIAESRAAVLAVLDAQGFGQIVRNFVGVVAGNRRLPQLRAIVEGFAALVAARRGVMVVDVTTAHGLNDQQRHQLRARLAEIGYGQITLREQVDPGLLGGLTVKLGARLYDHSLKSRLQRLQRAMKGAA